MLTDVSVRDGFFAEIYHPETGEIYGGLQERDGILKYALLGNRRNEV